MKESRWLPFGGAWSLVYFGLSVAAVVPLLSVAHPPLQDMPQHLAAISVLRHYPEFGLGEYFELSLLRTQYLAYYAAAYLLSFIFGLALANKLLLCAAVIGLPWSLGFLFKALGRDPRIGLFAFGLSYNAHLILGFLNFIAALPLMIWGLTLALHFRREGTKTRGVALACLLVACFYMHIVPFAFLALGAALVLVGCGVRATLRRVWVFLPACAGVLSWLLLTPAGSSTLAAAGGASGKRGAQFASTSQALRELPMWLTDVLTSERDEQLFQLWCALFGLALLLGVVLGIVGIVRSVRAKDAADRAPFRASPSVRLVVLCPLAALLYFVAPTGYDWIWPISARFPLIALLFASLLLPSLRGAVGHALFAALGLICVLNFATVTRAFAAFEREEVLDLDAAVASIPAGQRVAGLMFRRGSQHVKFSPFLHAVAYYQAARGGAVMFTFADFPQSPFHFRDAHRPARVPPRWEWLPDRVEPGRDLSWYNYVLTRGGPGRIGRNGEWVEIFRGAHGQWRVFRKK